MAAPRTLAAPPERRTVRHPLFGSVPLVAVPHVASDGRTFTSFTWDPAYRPELPAGAVRGDIRKQIYCCDTPRYFYVDLPRTCRDCKAPFVFTAREQKHWYEALGFRLDSTAVRCLPCRRAFRRERGIAKALADASRALAEAPLHPAAVTAYARAAVAHAEHFGHAPLDTALGQLRALRATSPDTPETLYWEGRCHLAAGRPGKAGLAFERFLSATSSRRGLAPLRKDAETRIERAEAPP